MRRDSFHGPHHFADTQDMSIHRVRRAGKLTSAGALIGLLLLTSDTYAASEAEQDWLSRSKAAGVFYADNFSGVETDAELRARSWLNHKLNSTRMFLETRNTLSGGGAARIEVHPEDGESTATYAHSFDGIGIKTKHTKKKRLYYQFAVYMPNYILDHRFKTVANADAVGHKWAILQEPDKSFGKGEVVVTSARFSRHVSAYTVGPKGTHGFGRRWPKGSGNPCRPNSPDYQWQATVDAGPQYEDGKTDANSCGLFRRRYGMMHSYYKRHPVIYGRGTVSEQGYPEPESSRNGIVWAADAWNVIEIYVNEPAQTVRMWHARRGDPPRLVIDAVGTANMGFRHGNYAGAQLLPRLEERAPDLTREATYAIYDEIIASSEPIPFPGGHRIENQKQPPR
jgi:hypothetical protein